MVKSYVVVVVGGGLWNCQGSNFISHTNKSLIGQQKECYIVQEVFEVAELDKGNISAASGKQFK